MAHDIQLRNNGGGFDIVLSGAEATPSPTPSLSISATPSLSISTTPSLSISETPSLSISLTPTPSITPTPSPWCLSTFTDDFESYTIGQALGGQGNWVAIGTGTGPYVITGKYIAGPAQANQEGGAYRTESVYNDQYAQCSLVTIGSDEIGVAIRCSGSGSGSYYFLYYGSNNSRHVAMVHAGTFEDVMGTTGSTIFGAGVVIRLEVHGTILRAYYNGSIDTSLSGGGEIDITSILGNYPALSGGTVGIATYPTTTGQNSSIDSWEGGCLQAGTTPSPTPSLSISTTPSLSISATPSLSISSTQTPSLSISATPSLSISATQTPSITPTRTPSLSISTTQTPSLSISATPSLSISATPSLSISATPSLSISATRTPSLSISATQTPSLSISTTPTLSISATQTPSLSISATPSLSISATPSLSISATQTPSLSISATPSLSISATQTPSLSISATPSLSISTTPSLSISATQTPSLSISATPSLSISTTQTPSLSISTTPGTTASITPTQTPSLSISSTQTPSLSISTTPSLSISATQTPSLSISATRTPSLSISATPSLSISPTRTPSLSVSITPSLSISATQTPSLSISTTPSLSISATQTPSLSISSSSGVASPSPTPSLSMSATQTPSLSISVTPSISISMTPSLSISRTRTPSITPSETPSISISISPSLTPSITPTKTPSPSEGAIYSHIVVKNLGPELVDQTQWNATGLGWWGTKDAGWTADNTKVISDGTGSGQYLDRRYTLEAGKTYRWEMSVTSRSGMCNVYAGQYPNFYTITSSLDHAVFYPTSNETYIVFYGMNWDGDITFLSVREVLSKIAFGLHGDEEWGPTAITEYWNGIDPPASGYTIYTLTASRHEPSIVVAHNDDECIWFARSFGGTDINTINEAINYLLSGSTETTIVNSNSLENIVTDGLFLYVDPGILPSYPRTGTHATDLAYATGWDFGGSTVSFDPITQSFNFDDSSTAKYIVTDTYFTILSPTTGMTYDFWCYLSSGGSSGLPSLFFDRGQSSIPFVWIYENSGYMAIQYSYGAGYTAINFTTTVRDVWRHIVITFQYGSSSDTEIKSYINSNIDLSHKPNITSLFPSEYTDKYIGCYGISNGHNWNGKIGPVKIYNRVLSQAEVLQNYNATKNRYGL